MSLVYSRYKRTHLLVSENRRNWHCSVSTFEKMECQNVASIDVERGLVHYVLLFLHCWYMSSFSEISYDAFGSFKTQFADLTSLNNLVLTGRK
jgi:hypothetical protein